VLEGGVDTIEELIQPMPYRTSSLVFTRSPAERTELADGEHFDQLLVLLLDNRLLQANTQILTVPKALKILPVSI
jgi:hypothetical protein